MSDTRMMCRFCGSVFRLDDVSKPMKGAGRFNWVWVEDQCPICKRGFDDWYVYDKAWPYHWLDAVRFQRNIKEVSE